MADNKRVWVDPKSNALAFLGVQKPKREVKKPLTKQKQNTEKQEGQVQDKANLSTTQAIVRIKKPKILPRKAQALEIQRPALPSMQVPGLEDLLWETKDALDLQKREGFLDNFFGRIDYRIEKKTERAYRLVELRAAWVANLEQLRKLAESYCALDQVRYKAVIEQIKAQRTLLEEQYRLSCAAKAVERQEAIEEAETETRIAKYKKEVREAERDPLPLPAPVDEVARKRGEANRERKLIYELTLDELDSKVQFESDKAERGVERILKVYANPHIDRQTMGMRILEIIDTYKIDESILPRGVQELLTEEDPNNE